MSRTFQSLHLTEVPSEIFSPEFVPRRRSSQPPIRPAMLPNNDKSVWDYWQILRNRWKTVLVCVIVGVAAAGLISALMTRTYTASGRISANPQNSDALGLKGNGHAVEDTDVILALDTQVDLLQSDSLALGTIEKLGLTQNATFTSGGTPTQDEVLQRLKRNLEIARLPRSRIIEVRYSNSDPRLAASVVNTLINLYLETNFRNQFQATTHTSQWLSGQLDELKNRVEISQAALVDYQKQHGILGFDDKQNIVTSKLDDLNKDLTAAQAERIQKEANYRMAESGSPELIAGSDPNSLMQKLRAQQSDLRNQYALATASLGSAHPKVIELNSQMKQLDETIRAEIQKIAARSRTEYEAAKRREDMLRGALETQKTQANTLNQSAIKYNMLKREYESNRQLYDDLLQKYKEASISAGLRADNIRVVDEARVPERPVRPNVPRNLGIGFLMSLIAGVVLAFGLDKLSERQMQDRICTPQQIQEISGLDFFGFIPAAPEPSRKQLASSSNGHGAFPVALSAYSRPRSQMSEAYRALRTSILLSGLDSESKVILVTSALPQEGKTTTSMNLATVLAQNGRRVLLVDADLRRPGLHKILGIKESSMGLARALTGEESLNQSIVATPQKGLYVMPAGPCPANPAEMLSSPGMDDLNECWREQFDHIVLDSPPVLAVTDPVLLTAFADSVLLVVRVNTTPIPALVAARDQLLKGKPRRIAVVVNAIDGSSARNGYYGPHCSYGYYEEADQQVA